MHQYGPSPGIPDETADELYESAPCGYLTTDVNGQILRVNRTLTEWLGYDRSELIEGKRFEDLLTIGGRIFYSTHINILLRVRDDVNEIALDIVCKNGRVLPALVNARQKRDPSGDPILNRFTIIDATERRLYERELLVARDLFQTTLRSIGDGVIATDAQQRITFTNPVAEQITGWTSDDAKGKHLDEVMTLVCERDGGRVENPITSALRAGTTAGLENHTELIRKDGRCVPIDDSASPVLDDSGEVMGGVIVFRDISERRVIEKALGEAHAQLETTAAELRRSNEDLSEFAHVASHDLRFPLNNIIQFSQLLEREHGSRLGDSGKEILDYVTDAARRMDRLIGDLLEYAQVSAQLTTPSEPIDVNIILDLAASNLRTAIQESGGTITRGTLPIIQANLTGLVQLFQNLIGNALHYRAADPPAIHIEVSEQAGQWLFSCKDNGIGIRQEYHNQIFQPFRRLHGIDRPGTGLGLAVCRKVVERYNGQIWVESQENVGSTFFFTFPKVPQDNTPAVV